MNVQPMRHDDTPSDRTDGLFSGDRTLRVEWLFCTDCHHEWNILVNLGLFNGHPVYRCPRCDSTHGVKSTSGNLG